MPSAGEEGGRVSEPAIRIFRRSPFRLLVLGGAALVLAAVAATSLSQQGSTEASVVLAAALATALWCGWASLRVLRSVEDELRLDAAGFTLRRGGAERRVLWREVPSRFRTVRLWLDTVIVWSTDGNDPPNGYFRYQARAARGLVDSIPGDYHWNPFLLARIMNQARARGIAGPTSA
jgi:hypothetical protein